MSDSEKLWGGRFSSPVEPGLHRYTAALAFDRRLARYDLVGSMAHARMLFDQAILEEDHAVAILEGLSGLLSDIENATMEVEGDDEDIHSWIERRLGERIGEAARRLHTGRSRNDQTAIALRLYLRDALLGLEARARAFQEVLLGLSKEHLETWMPGYTHLQRGQPVTLAHHLLAHFWALEADLGRLHRSRESAGVSPLGAAALAGTPHAIDPHRSAQLLGLERVYPNSMHAVADRDYVLEAAFACSMVMLHLSRFATEVILWTTAEFGFARLDDSVAKGSSIMPQKRNPEPAELLRGKTGRVVGDLMALAMVVKGLPLTYNSDLQEDKESLFDALDTTHASLEAATAIVSGLHFQKDRMRAALVGGFLTATDLADYLVGKGAAFRTAHHDTGRVVQLAEDRGVELWELSLDEVKSICPAVEEDVFEALRPEGSVRRHDSYGGPAPSQVATQIDEAAAALAVSGQRLKNTPESPVLRAHREGRLLAEDLG